MHHRPSDASTAPGVLSFLIPLPHGSAGSLAPVLGCGIGAVRGVASNQTIGGWDMSANISIDQWVTIGKALVAVGTVILPVLGAILSAL